MVQLDLDNYGLLDLVTDPYVTWDWEDVWCGEYREGHSGICHLDVFQPITLSVYHNDGNGHLTEVAQKLGLDKPAKALVIAIADYGRDGRIDIKRIHVCERSKCILSSGVARLRTASRFVGRAGSCRILAMSLAIGGFR